MVQYTRLGLRPTPGGKSSMIFTVRRNGGIASAVLATAIPSVRLSVCLSVRHTPVLCQNDGT